jgi:hypothetical protein
LSISGKVVTLQPLIENNWMKNDKMKNQYRVNEQIRVREVRIAISTPHTIRASLTTVSILA